MSMFKWEVVDPAPGEAVAPNQRLAWGKTVGVGAQHVVAMFGATFVFPLVMGLDANLAIMFSGICTILFLLITQNKVPSYLGTSASFVGGVVAIRAQGGDSADVTGAIMVAGLVLLAVGVLVHFAGVRPDPQDPAAGGHGRGRHADRLQPRAGRGQHLLAPGPVGGAAHRRVHGVRGGAAPRVLGADRGPARAGVRLPALVVVRRDLRHDQLGRPRARHGGHRPRPAVGLGQRVGRPTGSASRAARSPTGWTSSTARASR